MSLLVRYFRDVFLKIACIWYNMLIIFIKLLEKTTTKHFDKMNIFNEIPCFIKHSSKLFFCNKKKIDWRYNEVTYTLYSICNDMQLKCVNRPCTCYLQMFKYLSWRLDIAICKLFKNDNWDMFIAFLMCKKFCNFFFIYLKNYIQALI